DERERVLQCLRERLVGPARLGDPGRVIVGEYDGRSVVMQSALDDLTRENAGLRQRAAEQLLDRKHTILRIQENGEKHLVWAPLQLEPEIVAHRLRRAEGSAAVERFPQCAPAHLQYRLHLSKLGVAEAG